MLRRVVIVLLVALLMAMGTGVSSAQTIGILQPGGGQIGSLSAQVPIALYTFQGNQGELAQITMVGLQPGMTLTASLQDPFQQPAGSSSADATPGSATLNALLPTTGVYSVLVGGTAGDFVISLSTISTSGALQFSTDSQQSMTIAGTQPVIASFSSSPTAALAVTISATAGLRYTATLFDGQGQIVGTVYSAPQTCFTLAQGDTLYRLLATGLSPEMNGSLTLNFGASCGSGSGAPAVPVATTAPAVPINAQPTVCTAYSASAVNIRAGAGTEFAIIGQLSGSSGVPVTGTTNTGWLQVQTSSGTGYVSQPLVTLAGPCGAIPAVSAPAAPVGQATLLPTATLAGPTLTYTATIAGGPTQTYTPTQGATQQGPTATPTTQQVQPTATYTNTVPAPVAPPDSNYVLVVPLDNTTSVTDFVSSPEGDIEDVVSYDTSGLNPSSALPGGRGLLSIAITCFGTGTQNTTFRIDGQNYVCGQTFTREVNAQSDTGAVRITASGNSYVQWVLTGTLTRLN